LAGRGGNWHAARGVTLPRRPKACRRTVREGTSDWASAGGILENRVVGWWSSSSCGCPNGAGAAPRQQPTGSRHGRREPSQGVAWPASKGAHVKADRDGQWVHVVEACQKRWAPRIAAAFGDDWRRGRRGAAGWGKRPRGADRWVRVACVVVNRRRGSGWRVSGSVVWVQPVR
jgi:hypothetical protein